MSVTLFAAALIPTVPAITTTTAVENAVARIPLRLRPRPRRFNVPLIRSICSARAMDNSRSYSMCDSIQHRQAK